MLDYSNCQEDVPEEYATFICREWRFETAGRGVRQSTQRANPRSLIGGAAFRNVVQASKLQQPA